MKGLGETLTPMPVEIAISEIFSLPAMAWGGGVTVETVNRGEIDADVVAAGTWNLQKDEIFGIGSGER